MLGGLGDPRSGPGVNDDDTSRRSEDDTAVVGAVATEASDPGPQGAVGRYAVLEELGRGGMGRVVRAYDPKLRREVALKEVLGRWLDEEASRRLVLEARAMAKLAHPNVVAIYDVEEQPRAGVVIVMELVVGKTLSAWLRAESRPWTEIVGCFRRAGRGLAAAHAVGLLHRDFKPDNVLVAEDGAVKVTDFGLAKLDGGECSVDESSEDLEIADERSGGLTETGYVMGTPLYMAPEQHRAESLTPAADQYAFCVALWRALTGTPPFRRGDLEALKAEGPPRWPGGATPRRVVEAIERGLSPDPELRWPSMDSLLAALDDDPARRRRTRLRAVLGGGVAVAAALGARTFADAGPVPCAREDSASHLAGVWDDARRTEIGDAMSASRVEYADATWARTELALDAYASSWTALHVDVCEATAVRGEQSAAVMDLRMACLHRAEQGLAAVTTTLARGDRETVQDAHQLIGQLLPLERCSGVQALQADHDLPLPHEEEAVDRGRARMLAARAARTVGDYEQARSQLDQAKAELRGVEYPRLRAALLVEEGTWYETTGDYDAASKLLREGLAEAARARDEESMHDAASMLLFVTGDLQQRLDEAMVFFEIAKAVARGDAGWESQLYNNLSLAQNAQGRYADSEASARRALARAKEVEQPRVIEIAAAHNNIGMALFSQGRYDESLEHSRAALALQGNDLGWRHPDVALSRNNIAAVHFRRSELDQAAEQLRQSLDVWNAAFGADNPRTLTVRLNLASILYMQESYAEAEAEYASVCGSMRRSGGELATVETCERNWAAVLVALDRPEEAIALLEGVLPQLEVRLGSDHPDVADACLTLAEARAATGQLAQAERLVERAVAIRSDTLGAEHPRTVAAKDDLAALRLQRRLHAPVGVGAQAAVADE